MNENNTKRLVSKKTPPRQRCIKLGTTEQMNEKTKKNYRVLEFRVCINNNNPHVTSIYECT